MNTPEFTVYPYHCEFLKDFPELSTWLTMNGFSLLHSHNDFKTRLLHTYWDDRTADEEKNETNEAHNSVMITYCQFTRTIAVYHREIVTASQNESTLVRELDRHIYGMGTFANGPDGSPEARFGEHPLSEENTNL